MDLRIRLLWLPQAQFAGYLLAERQRESGSPRLVCQPADFTTGPIEAVLAGDSEFAVASPGHILESETPKELVWLLTIQQDSPLVYPVWSESGIETPNQLDGKTAAVWPGHEDLEFQWMLYRAGLDPARVRREETQNTVEAFLAREADCAQMTCYHEQHELEDALPDASAVRFLRAADYGAALLKDGLVARRSFVRENPELTQAVVTAVLDGWSRAFADPERAVAVCAEARPDVSRGGHARQLEDIRALTATGATGTHGLGFPDPCHAENAITAACDIGLDRPAMSADEMIAAEFWEAAPESTRPKAL